MNYYEGKKGWIEVICGPMFSGKTEALLKIIERMDLAKKKYIIFKPKIDTRYSINQLVSHNQKTIEATNISHGSDISRHIKDCHQAIVIDEAQFFDKSLVKYLQEYSQKGLRIIVAGLDKDFKCDPFGPMGDILAIADKVTKLTAVCQVCGCEATRTQRIIDGEPAHFYDPQILVGTDDKYEARCKDCHIVIYD